MFICTDTEVLILRCENCPALITEGYEYPESYCSVYPEDDWVDFSDGSCGCRHPLNAINKRIQENEKFESHRYDGIIEFYQEESKKEEAILGSVLKALTEKGCCIAYKSINNELRQIDISVFDERDEALRCDSLSRAIIVDVIDILDSNGYVIKKKPQA